MATIKIKATIQAGRNFASHWVAAPITPEIATRNQSSTVTAASAACMPNFSVVKKNTGQRHSALNNADFQFQYRNSFKHNLPDEDRPARCAEHARCRRSQCPEQSPALRPHENPSLRLPPGRVSPQCEHSVLH